MSMSKSSGTSVLEASEKTEKKNFLLFSQRNFGCCLLPQGGSQEDNLETEDDSFYNGGV